MKSIFVFKSALDEKVTKWDNPIIRSCSSPEEPNRSFFSSPCLLSEFEDEKIDAAQKIIWTIGHSTRALNEFVGMLTSFQIESVADIRSFPGSRRYPQFNKEALAVSLPENNIKYIHLNELGGRRKVQPDSVNTGWRLDAFRGYADYMETDAFKSAIHELESLAHNKRIAYMCSESLWWRCHRSIVSDYLKARGWTVIHIMDKGKAQEHTYTSPAEIINGTLTYHKK